MKTMAKLCLSDTKVNLISIGLNLHVVIEEETSHVMDSMDRLKVLPFVCKN